MEAETKCGVDPFKVETEVATRLIDRSEVFITRGEVEDIVGELLHEGCGVKPDEAYLAMEERGATRLYDIDLLRFDYYSESNLVLLIPGSLEARLSPDMFKRLLRDIADLVDVYSKFDEEVSYLTFELRRKGDNYEPDLPSLDKLVARKLYVWLRHENEHSWDNYGVDWYHGMLALEYRLGDEVVYDAHGNEHRRIGNAWLMIGRNDGEYYFRRYGHRPVV